MTVGARKGCIILIMVLISTLSNAQAVKEVLEKWTVIGNANFGSYSVRAVPPDGKRSLFADHNNEYNWYVCIDYKTAVDGVAFNVIDAFFNCKNSSVNFEQSFEYSSEGKAVRIVGEKNGKRQLLPAPPDSMGSDLLKFVCAVRFDG